MPNPGTSKESCDCFLNGNGAGEKQECDVTKRDLIESLISDAATRLNVDVNVTSKRKAKDLKNVDSAKCKKRISCDLENLKSPSLNHKNLSCDGRFFSERENSTEDINIEDYLRKINEQLKVLRELPDIKKSSAPEIQNFITNFDESQIEDFLKKNADKIRSSRENFLPVLEKPSFETPFELSSEDDTQQKKKKNDNSIEEDESVGNKSFSDLTKEENKRAKQKKKDRKNECEVLEASTSIIDDMPQKKKKNNDSNIETDASIGDQMTSDIKKEKKSKTKQKKRDAERESEVSIVNTSISIEDDSPQEKKKNTSSNIETDESIGNQKSDLKKEKKNKTKRKNRDTEKESEVSYVNTSIEDDTPQKKNNSTDTEKDWSEDNETVSDSNNDENKKTKRKKKHGEKESEISKANTSSKSKPFHSAVKLKLKSNLDKKSKANFREEINKFFVELRGFSETLRSYTDLIKEDPEKVKVEDQEWNTSKYEEFIKATLTKTIIKEFNAQHQLFLTQLKKCSDDENLESSSKPDELLNSTNSIDLDTLTGTTLKDPVASSSPASIDISCNKEESCTTGNEKDNFLLADSDSVASGDATDEVFECKKCDYRTKIKSKLKQHKRFAKIYPLVYNHKKKELIVSDNKN